MLTPENGWHNDGNRRYSQTVDGMTYNVITTSAGTKITCTDEKGRITTTHYNIEGTPTYYKCPKKWYDTSGFHSNLAYDESTNTYTIKNRNGVGNLGVFEINEYGMLVKK